MPLRLSLRFTQLVGKRDLFFFYTPGNVADISSCSLILQRNSVAEPEDKRRRIDPTTCFSRRGRLHSVSDVVEESGREKKRAQKNQRGVSERM